MVPSDILLVASLPLLGTGKPDYVAATTLAKEKLAAGEHDLLILDEMTYAVTFGWIDVNDVVTAVRDRAPGTNVVITGRDAPEELIAIADTVTEMRKVKHAFDSGIKAIKGIEY